ncbi:hypothetical protein [Roseateles sp.]|uniref:hypothetical protein n=1 Tax=Roseateles sp. TaxID=1971397 RepID=UPI002F3E88CD
MSTNKSSNNSAPGGIGLPGVVFVVFLILKLVGVIDWSWWWVTAPLWASALIWLAVVVGIALVALVAAAVKR